MRVIWLIICRSLSISANTNICATTFVKTNKQNENKNIKQNTDNLVSVVFRTTYYKMDILLKPYSRCGLKPYSGAKGNEANH